MKISLLASLVAVGIIALPAQAATIWDFTSNNNGFSVTGGTNYGNTYKVTLGGVTATITAWGLTGSNNTTFQTAAVGDYSVGMGICSRADGSSTCASPEHQIDNSGANEFMLIQFSSAVDISSLTIQPFGTNNNGYDRDVTYFLGNLSGSLNGATVGSLTGLGFGSQNNNDSTVSASARTVTINSAPVTSILFGARIGAGADNTSDYFKIESMTTSIPGNSNAVPEPATLSLLGASLAGLGLIGRNRRNGK